MKVFKIKVDNILVKLCFLIFFFSSCTDRYVTDPIDPRLPAYLTGNNIAGALVNDSLWIAQLGKCIYRCNNGVEFISDTVNAILTVSMVGLQPEKSNSNLDISIVINNVLIKEWEDFFNLKGETFTLEQDNYAFMGYNYECLSAVGQINFLEVQEKDNDNFKVAGTFGFEIENENCKVYKVYKGRFSRAYRKDSWQKL